MGDYKLSFSELVNTRSEYIFCSYLDIIAQVNAQLSGSRIYIFPLELFIEEPRHYIEELSEGLSLNINLTSSATFPATNSLPVPTFVRGREIIEQNEAARDIIKNPEDVYFCRGGMPQWIAKSDAYDQLKEIEHKWREPLDTNTATAIFDSFYANETAEIEKLLGADLGCWRVARAREPKTVVPLSEAAALTNTSVALWYCHSIYRLGDSKRARNFLTQAIEREPRTPEYHELLSRILLDAGETSLARVHARTAVSLAPAVGDYHVFDRYVTNRLRMAQGGL